MEETIENEELSLDETIKAFVEIKNEASDCLPRTEATIVIAAVDIGIHSMVFWNENITTWANLLSHDDPNRRINWREVGAWDIAGAIGGGVAASMTGGGAIDGAAAGAVGTSLASAIYQLIVN